MADPITGLIVGGAITCGLGVMGIVYKANYHEFHARFNPFIQDLTHRCWQYWLPIPERNSEDASSESSQGDIENQRHTHVISTHHKNKKTSQEDTHENSSDGSGDEIIVVVKHSRHTASTHHSKHGNPTNKESNKAKKLEKLDHVLDNASEDGSFKSVTQDPPHHENENKAMAVATGLVSSFAGIAGQSLVSTQKKNVEEEKNEKENFVLGENYNFGKPVMALRSSSESLFYDAESSPTRIKHVLACLNIERPIREVEHRTLESESSLSALDLAPKKHSKSKIEKKSSDEGYKGALADILFPQKSSSSEQSFGDNLERIPSFRRGSLESDSSPILDPGISIANQVRNMFGIPLQHDSSPRSDDSTTSSIVFAGLENGYSST